MLGLEPLTAWRGKGEPPGSAHLPSVLKCSCKELTSLHLSRWGSQGLVTAFAALWTSLPLLCSCICPGGSSAWREPPLDLLVDNPSCSPHLYSKVTFSVRPLCTLVTQPPSLSPHTHTLRHLPQSIYQPIRETLHSLGSQSCSAPSF